MSSVFGTSTPGSGQSSPAGFWSTQKFTPPCTCLALLTSQTRSPLNDHDVDTAVLATSHLGVIRGHCTRLALAGDLNLVRVNALPDQLSSDRLRAIERQPLVGLAASLIV